MPNAYVNKVVANSVIKLDLTADTVDAAHLAQGYTAHDASGAPITGTATSGGGGSVTQDANGFIVLPETGGGGGGSTGLVYETGTWTPTNDTANYEIEFLNTHTTAPCVYLIGDTEGDYLSTSNTNFGLMFADWHTAFGVGFDTDDSGSYRYGRMQYVYRATSATSFADAGTGISNDTGSSSTTATLYWASSTRIRAATNGSSRFWRAGRTYKWLAIWAPTS